MGCQGLSWKTLEKSWRLGKKAFVGTNATGSARGSTVGGLSQDSLKTKDYKAFCQTW